MTTGEAIAAVFEAYAAARGKPRWGDKTPLYMQYLPLLERALPDGALRAPDPRRAGRGALVPRRPRGDHDRRLGPPARRGGVRMPVGHRDPRRAGPRARASGGRYLEVRYEALVAAPENELQRVCGFAGLEYDDAMLGYVGETESARKEHQQRLNEPPRVGVRDWRTEMPPGRPRGVRGGRGRPPARARLRGRRARPRRARRLPGEDGAWRAVGAATQRSPLWRRRHAVLQ